MSAQAKKQFGSGCLLILQDDKVILTNSSHQHLVLALGDLRALVRLWNEHGSAMVVSMQAAGVVHLRTTQVGVGVVNTACGIETSISDENVRWTKNMRLCTCARCIETLVNKDAEWKA